MLFFNILMTLIYAGIGITFLFTDILLNQLPDNRKLVGGIFLGYSVFRSVVIIQKMKKRNEK
ncbi:MAG: hypothetical protein POELPBGB_02165 [Bacteroidia bacterium]|nr:hypothetical protein [Bacteroidia bacterium]